jgi:hypothetical protein
MNQYTAGSQENPDRTVSTDHSSTSPADVLAEAELLDAPGGSALRLRFPGPFEGRIVTWDATFVALGGPRTRAGPGTSVGNFIEIGEDGPNGVAIRVGLQVARIDAPTIRKTMIMIRRYRRLRRGRHDYGAGPSPAASGSPNPSG